MTAQQLCRHQLDDFLESHFKRRADLVPAQGRRLLESMRYALFSGGKRFRPFVSVLTADVLGCARERVWPFAAAVELVHTYSLIHDDLPCMDDDQWRRGQPTNHTVYGEALALLAGDALLTEAFYILSEYYSTTPEVGLRLSKLLSEAAGLTGMVAGQVMDISATQNLTKEEIIKLHELKTGALIGVSVEGVAEISRATDEQKRALREFGQKLGLAFQLADDILDFKPSDVEVSGFPQFFGLEGTQSILKETSQAACQHLEIFGESAAELKKLVDYNLGRES